jgi:transposase InsO family protein
VLENQASPESPLSETVLPDQQQYHFGFTLHADRGCPMKAKATALLLADLGVTRSHNRPHTSNDNPFSESDFKTLKYQSRLPQRFGCIEDAKSFCHRSHHPASPPATLLILLRHSFCTTPF